MTQVVIKKEQTRIHGTNTEIDRREVILTVLSRAADDCQFMAQLAETPAEALEEYYILTSEELAALTSGDISLIESWVGKLDARHAQWLVNRLCQEKW